MLLKHYKGLGNWDWSCWLSSCVFFNHQHAKARRLQSFFYHRGKGVWHRGAQCFLFELL